MMTPGASDTSEEAARFGSGSAATMSRVTVWATMALCVSSTGVDAFTSTNSVCPSTSSVMSTAMVRPTSSTIPDRIDGAKPTNVISTRYGPGTRAPTRYTPCSLLTVSKVTLVSWLVTCTPAAAIGAPVMSLTMPVMLLEPLWPNAAADTIRLAIRARSVDRMESETRRVIVALWKTSKMVRARWQDVQRLWPEAQASQRDSVQDPCGLLPEEQHLFR